MPYVQRNQANKICGSFQVIQKGYAEEFVLDDDPGLAAYHALQEAIFMTANDEKHPTASIPAIQP